MEICKRQEGQTLIETAIVLFLLLLILLGITEFARAWYTKNSLKNAARQGARTAVVITPASSITPAPSVCPVDSTGQILCPDSRTFTPCPDSSPSIVNSVCTLPGVSTAEHPDYTGVNLCYSDAPGGTSGTLDKGDTINVCIRRTNFRPLVPGLFSSFIPSQLYADASMRYE